jgi:hypothetical protein
MNQKNFANLNLNQSLENFQVNITKLLNLNNVIEWDGTIIKDREEKIREAALILAGQCVAILLDNLSKSTEVRETAINKTKGWWKTKTRRKKYTGEWIEPKLLTIYTVDERGKKIKNGEFPLINDGSYGNYKKFLKILEMYLVSLGISQAKQILLIANAAEWIWQHIPPLLNRLGCEKITHYRKDFYHVTEHLQSFADAAFNDNKERITWFKTARSDLKKGKVISLIDEMKQHRKPLRGQKREIITSQINYFTKRVSKKLFDYDKIVKLKLPIGSGAVESLIRQTVNLPLKGNGKFWLKENAEIILHARCQWLSGSWNNFTNSILTLRIYPAIS